MKKPKFHNKRSSEFKIFNSLTIFKFNVLTRISEYTCGSIMIQYMKPTTQNIPTVNTSQYKGRAMQPTVNVHI
jgi:hypothetical protein